MQEGIKADNYFDYRNFPDTTELYKIFPRAAADKIISYFSQLGEHFIKRFSVFKDSTIRYSIRDSSLEQFSLTMREWLSYFPNGGMMQHREGLAKDTMLNKNWQYWISFDKRRFFE